MDGSQEWDERLGQSTSSNSRHIMWKLSQEDKVGTFDSAVTHGLYPVHSEHVSMSKVINAAECKDPSIKRVRASENWQLLLHKLGKMKASSKEEPSSQPASDPALPELRDPSSKERSPNRFCSEIIKGQQGERGKEIDAEEKELNCKPSNKRGSKLVTDLKLESFGLPPQQSCVVREEQPKLAQGLLKDRYTDWYGSGNLEILKTNTGLDQVPNPLQEQSVDTSPPTSSPSAEATCRNTSQITRRSTRSKLSTGTDEVTATTAEGKKSLSIISGSSGPNFPNLRQRQQELHRYRVLIEQRRLDLLELRIAREREEAKQYMILFQKKMQNKECKLYSHEAYDCSNV